MSITDGDIERAGFNRGLEAAAKLAEGEVYSGQYRTWPWWPVERDGTRGNVHQQGEIARHCEKIAAHIRAMKQ